jgi:hypothetical protein
VYGEDAHADNRPQEPQELVRKEGAVFCGHLPGGFRHKIDSRHEREPVYGEFCELCVEGVAGKTAGNGEHRGDNEYP